MNLTLPSSINVRTTSAVLTSAPISVTNITGFFIMCTGSSLRKLAPMAPSTRPRANQWLACLADSYAPALPEICSSMRSESLRTNDGEREIGQERHGKEAHHVFEHTICVAAESVP